jgi:6-pyruvoyltetrahydropterin/6-carboxytetrahydropterin synthase
LELKQLLRQLCDGYDHRLLMPTKNPTVERLSEGENVRLLIHGREFEFPAEDLVWLPAVNTTVEELARVIADEVVKNLSAYPNVERIKVLVEESPGESATEERRVRA